MPEALTAYALENYPLLFIIALLIVIPVFMGSKWIRSAINLHIEKDESAHTGLGSNITSVDEKSRIRDEELKAQLEKQDISSKERDKRLESQLEKQHEKLENIDKQVFGISISLNKPENHKE